MGARGWVQIHRQRAGPRVVPRGPRRERGGAERRRAQGAVSHLEAAPAAPGLRRDDAAVPGVAG